MTVPPRGGEAVADAPVRPVVLIVDDQPLLADAVHMLLVRYGWDSRPPAGSAVEALRSVADAIPDLVLVGTRLPDMSGLELGRRLLQGFPGIKVLAYTAKQDADAARFALREGFSGYVTKDMPTAKFVRSLAAALEGEIIIPHELARAAFDGRSDPDRTTDLMSGTLTARELQILQLMAHGLSGPRMAEELYLSAHTIRSHVQRILGKLQVHSRLEAAAFAVEHGLVAVNGNGNENETVAGTD